MFHSCFPVSDRCRKHVFLHAQYDWTTGVLDNGKEWRKFRAVPRLYPLRSLSCTLFNKGGSRGAFRLPGTGGDHFHCTVEPSPGHIRCRVSSIRASSSPKVLDLDGCFVAYCHGDSCVDGSSVSGRSGFPAVACH